MPGTLTVRITESGGEILDLRYRYIWTVWLGGRLLGEGHAFNSETAESRALDLTSDLVGPREVKHIEIVHR